MQRSGETGRNEARLSGSLFRRPQEAIEGARVRYDMVIRAIQGKGSLKDLSGPRNMVRRISAISKRYGVNANAMQQTVGLFAEILGRFGCGATFPIPIRVSQKAALLSVALH